MIGKWLLLLAVASSRMQADPIALAGRMPPLPANGELTFDMLSDTHFEIGQPVPYEVHQRSYDLILSRPGDLIVHGGDMVESETDCNHLLLYLQLMHSVLERRPTLLTLGNREFNLGATLPEGKVEEIFGQRFESAFGKLTLGPVTFFFINTNLVKDTDPFNEQKQKLEQLLVDDTSPWLVFVSHHPPYTGMKISKKTKELKPLKEQSQLLQAELIPIIQRSRRKFLFFSGDTHAYQRIKRKNGTFLVSGPSGGKLAPKDRFVETGRTKKIVFAHTITHVVATHDTLRVQVQDDSGKVVDKFKLSLEPAIEPYALEASLEESLSSEPFDNGLPSK